MKTIVKSKSNIKVSTGIKAGMLNPNHNRRASLLAVKSGIKAGEGILLGNHNRRVR